MKDIFKNPATYYVLVPVLTVLWPLLVWGLYLPRAEKQYEKQEDNYLEARSTMLDILRLDPGRAADVNDAEIEFNYTSAISKTASLCKIPPSKYRYSSGMTMKTRERKIQPATLSLNEVDIVAFAKFLSTIQVRWAKLQCEQVKLIKKKNMPDIWDAEIRFKYYY
ncbi:MAG: hypothetical protein JSU94_22040 [Phycisphaerales bacterium]|nr:MAG: hypothetical protein JSU94_22040 [Phycisphaerales bacterium]